MAIEVKMKKSFIMRTFILLILFWSLVAFLSIYFFVFLVSDFTNRTQENVQYGILLFLATIGLVVFTYKQSIDFLKFYKKGNIIIRIDNDKFIDFHRKETILWSEVDRIIFSGNEMHIYPRGKFLYQKYQIAIWNNFFRRYSILCTNYSAKEFQDLFIKKYNKKIEEHDIIIEY